MGLNSLSCSVLIASLGRPDSLKACLTSLVPQTHAPDEIVVVWQGEDVQTRDAAEVFRGAFQERLKVLHCTTKSIVAASETGLTQSQCDVILMIDDDACAPPDWVARHLAAYGDDTVMATGGLFRNFLPDGKPYPVHAAQPVGRLRWYGRLLGNMYDHPKEWAARPLEHVEHLLGANLSFRRRSVDGFELKLRPYWQSWEVDLCLQAARSGKINFDYSNIVEHHPTNKAHDGRREGNYYEKFWNPAYNQGFIFAKHGPIHLSVVRLVYLILIGTYSSPGILRIPGKILRHGQFVGEFRFTLTVVKNVLSGWFDGAVARRKRPRVNRPGAPAGPP